MEYKIGRKFEELAKNARDSDGNTFDSYIKKIEDIIALANKHYRKLYDIEDSSSYLKENKDEIYLLLIKMSNMISERAKISEDKNKNDFSKVEVSKIRQVGILLEDSYRKLFIVYFEKVSSLNLTELYEKYDSNVKSLQNISKNLENEFEIKVKENEKRMNHIIDSRFDGVFANTVNLVFSVSITTTLISVLGNLCIKYAIFVVFCSVFILATLTVFFNVFMRRNATPILKFSEEVEKDGVTSFKRYSFRVFVRKNINSFIAGIFYLLIVFSFSIYSLFLYFHPCCGDICWEDFSVKEESEVCHCNQDKLSIDCGEVCELYLN